MARVYEIEQPDNNVKHSIALEDNAVLLSGYCSDVGEISNGALFAITGGMLQTFILDQGTQDEAIIQEWFPIGCNIYCYIGTETLTDITVSRKKFWSSWYSLSLFDNCMSGDEAYFQGIDEGIYMHVTVDVDNGRWKPNASNGFIVRGGNFTAGQFYIRLGSYNGDSSSLPADPEAFGDFSLEDNNKLYYAKTSYSLMDYASYLYGETDYLLYRKIALPLTEIVTGSNTFVVGHGSTDSIEGMPAGFYKVMVQRHLWSQQKEHIVYLTLRYKDDPRETQLPWTFIATANTTMHGNVATSDPDYGPDVETDTVVMSGFLNLASAVPSTYQLELRHEAGIGVVFGGSVPYGGAYSESMLNNDFILFERIGDTINN